MAVMTFLAAIQTVQKPLHGTNCGQNIACLMLFGGELPNNSFGGLGNKFTESTQFGLYVSRLVEGGKGARNDPKWNLHFYMRTFSQEMHKPTDICYANQTCNLTFFRRRIKALRVEQGNPKVKR